MLKDFTAKRIELFWRKVKKEAGPDGQPEMGCWLWQGARRADGYGVLNVRLVDGRRQNVVVHRLSWWLAHGTPPPERDEAGRKLVLRHTCDIRHCLAPHHLLPGTHAENSADMVARGRVSQGNYHWTRTDPEHLARGEHVGTAKLTEVQVAQIKAEYDLAPQSARTGKPIRGARLAERFSVTRELIWLIVNGKAWVHVDPAQIGTSSLPEQISAFSGEANPNAALTEETAEAIRVEYATGKVQQGELAAKYSVSLSTISALLSGKTWGGNAVRPEDLSVRYSHHKHGEAHPKAVLDELKVIEIKARFAYGETAKQIANSMKLTYNTVYDVCVGKSWKHVSLKGAMM